MQVFKAISPFHVLSFDLDDTLYNNKPVIEKAEQAMLNELAKHTELSAHTTSKYWWHKRLELAKANPDIRHDLGRWRLLATEAGLIELGLKKCEAGEIAELAYNAFLHERTNIVVSNDTQELIKKLSEKYQLIAITNGNACIKKMGLGEYFQFSLQAGPDGRMKPYPDLFLNAAQRLNVAPKNILHIGDSAKADVLGALKAGCQAVWLDLGQYKPTVLPHIRITDIKQLHKLR